MSLKETISGIINLGGARVLAAALSFVATSLTARALGPADIGIFSVIVGWYAYVSLLGEFGLRSVVMTQAARADNIASVFAPYIRLRLLLTIGAYLLSILIAYFAQPEYLLITAVIMASAFFFAFILDWILIVKGHFHIAGWTSISRWIFYTILVVIAWYFNALTLLSLSIIFSLSWLLGAVFCVVVIAAMKIPLSLAGDQKAALGTKVMLGMGLPILLGNLATQLLQNSDLLWIGAFRGSTEAGIYYIASALITAGLLFANAVSQVTLAKYARNKESDSLATSLKNDLMLLTAIGTVIGFALHLARPIIPLIFGEKFAPSMAVLTYFIPFYIIAHAFYLYYSFMIAKGFQKQALYALVLTLPFVPIAYLIGDSSSHIGAYALGRGFLAVLSMILLVFFTPGELRGLAAKYSILPIAITVAASGLILLY